MKNSVTLVKRIPRLNSPISVSSDFPKFIEKYSDKSASKCNQTIGVKRTTVLRCYELNFFVIPLN